MPYMNENLFIASLIRQFVPKKKTYKQKAAKNQKEKRKTNKKKYHTKTMTSLY